MSQIHFHFIEKPKEINESYIFKKEIWKNFFDNFLSSYFSKDELQKIYNGEEYNFDACEMCRRGIATHIMAEGKRIDAKKFKSIGK
ncbi:hypothetical protein A2331_02160 [Candidatus Falkowbacteria bacterium RIFOXYB2_FULL_34_18]|uniref:Uncharacterized protein n=1 Tax=Candidatus Falkowbacteria bacterium RIFOXYD2_FULL_34_120 TaxID=1798007 RepID=A0A1F5TQT5_9BACT|nr:MAG: hypothetical protein A2331_02160 [Candidatus Falkowbacteria bacterium RIFOXYB2_FULL_34_18]OGF29527.1 MAG: hypothetical protein A2500_02370 [Candidatus Falkowbacteria bacterium RIFOXYC12_FULL_34_55]OGF36863.1 MAG: hypothetical protein A2466_06600 [Candidatus Falkowbacteria bacterium RIFOXYC2_FULL_34_220]OGF39062.1 MAG: hypothetical protein A2515_04605 [Candidatus Falkowbacteria bacterium RIFOXYD12_FULL_34_57]OGF41285.1 MAG: hypothetical protein A2531_00285 [Candidatus Falkowbacteria bact